MVGEEEPNRNYPKQSENGEAKGNCVFSPGFRSVAEMAGWDEEALLAAASLVVEDTPDRDFKQKRRSDPLFKTPPTHSRRKRRDQRKSPVSKFVDVLNLEEECPKKEILEEKKIEKNDEDVNGKKVEKSNESSSGNALIPCIDRLREELSCAICLEICFEPSTTSCGHSFCKKCLRSAADKCGKRCPKCRQLISNGRSCTINTVLWNTIQLLFPQEIEARKVVAGGSNILDSGDLQSPPPRRRNQYRSVIEAFNSPEGEQLSMERRRRTSNHLILPRQQSFRPASLVILNSREAGDNSVGRRRRRNATVAVEPAVEQDQDAALALRLQRQEFMGAFGGSGQTQLVQQQNSRRSVATASVNLRAMASRAINIRNIRR